MTSETNPTDGAATPIMLEAVAAEIEGFVHGAGWDAPTMLFALVPTRTLAADPAAASMLSPDGTPLDPEEVADSAITPIAQEELPDGPLDEVLAQIGWPAEVIGCAVSQQILMLPPSAESSVDFDELGPEEAVETAASHPDRREARLVVAVLRSGQAAGILRVRGADGAADDLLTGQELAPNLVAALADTLVD